MEMRYLGTQGLSAGAIGYGAMGTSFGYGASSRKDCIDAIRAALDAGVTMFDTAEMYGWGAGERLLGAALGRARERVTVATKFGCTRTGGFDSRPKRIREAVDRSLGNLGVDSIDLLYQHRMDPAVPIEDVMGTLKGLVDSGKVRYVGLCEIDDASLRVAHATHPVSVVQSEYSIFARDVEGLFPTMRSLGVGFVAYSPLARGFLAGSASPMSVYSIDDFRRRVPWWHQENFAKNQVLVNSLREVALANSVTLAQLSLAWILSRGENIIAIPGARHRRRVEENVSAAEVDLSMTALARIEELVPDGAFGARI